MLTSQRLSYRRLTERDVDVFHALCLDEHIKRYLLDGEDMPRSWAAAAIDLSEQLFGACGAGLWLVQRNGDAIGFCGFRVFAELGPWPQLLYAFAGESRGVGFATEAAGVMLAETRRLGWSRVGAAVDGPNTASIRVLEKCGFVACGRVPGAVGETLLFERFDTTAPVRLPADSEARWELKIEHTWDGELVGQDEAVAVLIERAETELTLRIDAPFHEDPLPASDDLWNYEVAEVMLVGADDTYLEVELSPHGRYLVLFLKEERTVVHRGVRMLCRAAVEGGRWRAVAFIPIGWVPIGVDRLNAFAIHGTGQRRRHLAWKPTGGQRPDFHRLSAFGTLGDVSSPGVD